MRIGNRWRFFFFLGVVVLPVFALALWIPQPEPAPISTKSTNRDILGNGENAQVQESTFSLTPRPWGLLRNTLLLSAGACLVSLPIGIALAVLVFRTDVPGRRVAFLVLMGLLFLPLYIYAGAWDSGFGQQGWFTLSRGNLTQPIFSGWRAAVWTHGVAAIPWVSLIVGVGLRWIDPELEEAALLEGGLWKVFFHVTLPRAATAAGGAAIWVCLWTASEMTVTDLFRIRTFAEELYTGFALGETLGDAFQRVLPGVVLAIWFTFAAMILATFFAPQTLRASSRGALTFCLGRFRWPAAFFLVAVLAFLIGIPVINLCVKAGIVVEMTGGERVRNWSLLRVLEVVSSTPFRFWQPYQWTIRIAVASSVVTVVLAAFLSWRGRQSRFFSGVCAALVAVGLAVPAPLIGLALIGLLNWPNFELGVWLYDRTIFAPVAATTIRSLPLAILVMWQAWRSLPKEGLQAAEVEGIGALRRFSRIAVPQRWAALAIAWLVSFAITSGDLAASILVMPPGVATISMRTFGLIHAGVTDQVAGICLTHTLSFAFLGAVMVVLARLTSMGPLRVRSGMLG